MYSSIYQILFDVEIYVITFWTKDLHEHISVLAFAVNNLRVSYNVIAIF